MAREISIRTFCQPDSAVRKHLHDSAIVLDLIDSSAGAYNSLREIRTRILTDMSDQAKKNRTQEEWERERVEYSGIARAWSPTKERR